MKKAHLILLSLLLLASCSSNYQTINIKINDEELIENAPTNNLYIQKSYEIGDFIELPQWAEDLKDIEKENSYAINIYSDFDSYREFTRELLNSNEIVFKGKLNEQKMFDTYNILVVVRRLDYYSYSPYCLYTNCYFDNNTNFIDINYGNQSYITNTNVSYHVDFVAIEKAKLSADCTNFVINQKYYKYIDIETKKVESFKSLCIEAKEETDFKAGAKIFNSYNSFCNYVGKFTDLKVKTFFDKSWFKNNYAIVVLRNSNALIQMCFEDIDIKHGKMVLTGYNVSGGGLALENYVDIIFVPKHELSFVNLLKKYQVEYNINYYN